jgi:hypothetical protein
MLGALGFAFQTLPLRAMFRLSRGERALQL